MRNRFPGPCYRCGEHVNAGEGHFERAANGWRTQHAECAIWWRGQQPTREDAAKRRSDFMAGKAKSCA